MNSPSMLALRNTMTNCNSAPFSLLQCMHRIDIPVLVTPWLRAENVCVIRLYKMCSYISL